MSETTFASSTATESTDSATNFAESSPECLSTTSSGFEGVEKKLEIDFKNVTSALEGALTLRAISREDWDAILWDAKCCILNVEGNNVFDAYLLSESSLFVYDSKIMIKTCGTTTLLLMIPRLLQVVRDVCGAQVSVDFLQFSRSAFRFPNEQRFPHTSFEDEVKFLQQHFEGNAYTLGKINGPTWHVYIADYTNKLKKPITQSEQSLEIVMHDLDESSMAHFFKGPDFVSSEEVTIASGIKGLMMEDSIIDPYCFDPCGYSLNALNGSVYYTIHITPEAHCSYVSFETNALSKHYSEVISKVISVFRPKKFAVLLIADDTSVASESDFFHMNCAIEGYRTRDSILHEFEGPFQAVYCNYTINDGADTKPLQMKRIPRAISFNSISNKYSLWNECADIMKEYSVIKVTEETNLHPWLKSKILDENLEESFFLVNLGILYTKYIEWVQKLPKVQPFYAVRHNATPAVLKLLNRFGCHFECYTQSEIDTVLAEGIPSSKILFSNPCNAPNQIKSTRKLAVDMLAFDSEGELQKIAIHHPNAELLMRISIPANTTETESARRYGVSPSNCHSILRCAVRLGLHIIGVSFDISKQSGTLDAQSYVNGLDSAAAIFAIADSMGIKMSTIDIGAIFPGVGANKTSLDSLIEPINQKIEELFPVDVRIIAEAGQFLITSCSILVANVFARKSVESSGTQSAEGEAQPAAAGYVYHINHEICGPINRLAFDNVHMAPVSLKEEVASSQSATKYPSAFTGPNSEELEAATPKILVPLLEVGDWIYFPNAGALPSNHAPGTGTGSSLCTRTIFTST